MAGAEPEPPWLQFTHTEAASTGEGAHLSPEGVLYPGGGFLLPNVSSLLSRSLLGKPAASLRPGDAKGQDASLSRWRHMPGTEYMPYAHDMLDLADLVRGRRPP